MEAIWTILICTMPNREHYLNQLLATLEPQVAETDGLVQILTLSDNGELTIGGKRNKLVEMCTTEYSSFIDDDDIVARNYVRSHLLKLTSNPDGVGFKGMMTVDGKRLGYFYHDDKFDTWRGDAKTGFIRCLNHWNVVRNEFRKVIPFPCINFAEDHEQSVKMKEAGLIKKSEYINEIMYFYQFRNGVSTTSSKTKKK